MIAIKNYISTYEQTRTIWMDGRPHPPNYAAHTWMGFSTGKWEGQMLTVYTTHIKTGWVRRNGTVESDQASLVEHFIRHGDLLTHVSVLTDPVYLTEPLVRTQNFALNLNEDIAWLWPCEYVDEIVGRPKGEVPNYLPGQNPFLQEFRDRWGIPEIAARGGAETMYPEFQNELKAPATAKTVADIPKARVIPARADSEIHVIPVQGNVYMLLGPGGNTAIQVGNQGILLVDTQTAGTGGKVLAEARKLSEKPLRYIINTGLDATHTGGNLELSSTGVSRKDIPLVNTPGQTAFQSVQILAHENVLDRMSQAGISSDAWPTDTYSTDEKELFFNNEAIQMFHPKAAHTDGDTIIFFRRSDVISTGDIFVTDAYPVIDLAHGGGLQGIIDGLNIVLDLAVPAHHEEGGTMVIPGRGRLCDEADVVEYRDMLTIIRDRLRAMQKKGMTVEQVKAARPTRDYDEVFPNATCIVTLLDRLLRLKLNRIATGTAPAQVQKTTFSDDR